MVLILGPLLRHLMLYITGDLPGLFDPMVEKLYAYGKDWLEGSVRPGEVF